ncbi:MAG: CHASE2 domain-containing protein [Bryobacterales bacterium]|nr:CHASE2 domain-containing protein [Bryobacterales bacterium]
MMINYAGPEGTFPQGEFPSAAGRTADPSKFRGKIVIVGVTAQGSGDRLFTPLSSGIGMSGIEIHANVARTILDRVFLVPLNVTGEFVGSLLLIGLCVAAIVWFRGLRLSACLVGCRTPARRGRAGFFRFAGYVLLLGRSWQCAR